MMWDSLKMHPDLKYNYLSPPDETSLHNYGCAADVTIMRTTDSTVLDMGTEFDQFSRLSQPIYETVFLKNGELDSMAWQNRRLLRYIMKRAGLKGINSEWWHFSLCTREEAAKGYQLIR
jgi:D-alanyl-D-alanine dipeptidase